MSCLILTQCLRMEQEHILLAIAIIQYIVYSLGYWLQYLYIIFSLGFWPLTWRYSYLRVLLTTSVQWGALVTKPNVPADWKGSLSLSLFSYFCESTQFSLLKLLGWVGGECWSTWNLNCNKEIELLQFNF